MSFLDLSMFDAIVVGPNAYLLRDELAQRPSIPGLRRQGWHVDRAVSGIRIRASRIRTVSDSITSTHTIELQTRTPGRLSSAAASAHDVSKRHFARRLRRLDSRPRALLLWELRRPLHADSGNATSLVESSVWRAGVIAGYGRGTFVYVGYSRSARCLPECPVRSGFSPIFWRCRKHSCWNARNVCGRFRSVHDRAARGRGRDRQTYMSAGTYLCRQGQLGQELFIVLKREIEIIRRVEGGRVVLKAREGQVVGQSAIEADTPRTADLRALTNVHLLGDLRRPVPRVDHPPAPGNRRKRDPAPCDETRDQLKITASKTCACPRYRVAFSIALCSCSVSSRAVGACNPRARVGIGDISGRPAQPVALHDDRPACQFQLLA